MSYLAASEERSEALAETVAMKLLSLAKERAIQDVFCAANHEWDDEPLLADADFYDALPGLYAEFYNDDGMELTGNGDIGNILELDYVPIISEKYEYATPLEVLDEIQSKASWNYQDLKTAAEGVALMMTGTQLLLPCFNDALLISEKNRGEK